MPFYAILLILSYIYSQTNLFIFIIKNIPSLWLSLAKIFYFALILPTLVGVS